VPEGLRDGFRLVDAAAPHRADIHLDQPDDVRILLLEEPDDVLQVSRIPEDIACPGHRHVGGGAGPDRVPDVVYKKTHVLDSVIACQPSLETEYPRFCDRARPVWRWPRVPD
jgi:hypothetical protein